MPRHTAERKLTSHQVIERLAHLFVTKGIPEHIRLDNGSEFTAKAIRKWLTDIGVTTLFIEPGSPWENGYVESLNGKLRDELLNGEIFTTLLEAKVLIENWRRTYNGVRPHSSLGCKPPAPETVMPNNGYLMEVANSEGGTMTGGRPRSRSSRPGRAFRSPILFCSTLQDIL
jgi:putative transposase